MTSPLPGYGVGLADELILGHIAWYTITKPKLTHDDIMGLVLTLGLDPSIAPSPPRKGDAFKRACRYSERKGIAIPYSPNTANFLIRPVTQTLEDVERHLVMEVIDPDGRKLAYNTAAELRFERKTGKLHVSVKTLDPVSDVLVDDTLKNFSEVLKESTKYVESQVIRRMIRHQLELMHSVLARSKGSVYFIPKRFNQKVEALEEFTSHCGVGSGFHSLPLIDDTKQREMVMSAFNSGVHDTATQLISELGGLIANDKKITPTAWNDYKNKYDVLVSKRDEYASLVDTEVMKSDVEIEALSTQLEEFLLTDLIKLNK
jgi:hypothetical protein